MKRKKTGPNPKSTAREIVGHHGHRPHGPSILWPALYEHLRAKGYSKEKSARISNAGWKKKRMGIATNTPTSVRGVVKMVDKSGGGLTPSPTVRTEADTWRNPVAKIKKDDLPAEVVEYIEGLEEALDDAETAIEERDGELAKSAARISELEAASTADSIAKGDPLDAVLAKADPTVAAIIKAQQADLAAMRETVAKAESEKVHATMVSKAASMVGITAETDDLAEVLKTAYGVSAEYGEKVETILKAASAQVESAGIWSELGKSGNTTTVSKSVDSIAAELRKNDPTLTTEQAIAKAYEQNPHLYDLDLKGA